MRTGTHRPRILGCPASTSDGVAALSKLRTMTSANTPAGWYDDGSGALRWWDGNTWTEHTQPERSAATADSTSPSDVQHFAGKADPAADPNAIWTAVGKPITGIGGGRYKLTEHYLFFERGTLSTKAQQISTHEIYDVDAVQTMTQKARGVGTIVLYAIRSGRGTRERVELVDVERFREGVAEPIGFPMPPARISGSSNRLRPSTKPDSRVHRPQHLRQPQRPTSTSTPNSKSSRTSRNADCWTTKSSWRRSVSCSASELLRASAI